MDLSVKMNRSHPTHLPLYDMGNRTRVVFVTVCTKDRKSILARQECVDVIRQSWIEATEWLVGRYMIMPDHIHLFCAPGKIENQSLKSWIAFWKSIVSRRWPHFEDGSIWQRDFWDRQLRSGEKYQEKWEYVRNNPVRAGIVTQPEDWLWQGEMHVLSWHEA